MQPVPQIDPIALHIVHFTESPVEKEAVQHAFHPFNHLFRGEIRRKFHRIQQPSFYRAQARHRLSQNPAEMRCFDNPGQLLPGPGLPARKK